MDRSGLPYDFCYASTYSGIETTAGIACRKGYDVVVAVGGDGTINAVLNGVYREEKEHKNGTALGVIYTGTSPDFCKSYNIPREIESAVEVLKNGKMLRMRPGEVRFKDAEGEVKDVRYFACCANIGLGAEVARTSNRIRKYSGDLFGTLYALVRAFRSFEPADLYAESDGIEGNIKDIQNISVGRTRYIASGIKAGEGIGPEDDGFYMVTISGITLKDVPQFIRSIYSGKLKYSKKITAGHVSELYLESHFRTVEVEFDGDPAGFLPCSFRVAEASIGLLSEQGTSNNHQ